MELYKGDSLELMKDIPDNSIDLLLTDFPYGVLNKRTEWDEMIDLDLFWEQFYRISKPDTPMITTGMHPFTSKIISSNYEDFKYCMVWEKSKATGFLNSKRRPLVAHEDIIVFYKKQCTYNPQKTKGVPYDKGSAVRDTKLYGEQTKAIHVKNTDGTRYPRSVQYFKTAESEKTKSWHPTQKPLALYEWLVKTYSNAGDIILDPFMGSGTTGYAAILNNRQFIGMEMDKEYFDKASKRLNEIQHRLL